jgi:hypothetical protein
LISVIERKTIVVEFHRYVVMPGETKKISIIIPTDLHRQLKRSALDDDTTITALIQGLIVEHLAKTNPLLSTKTAKD